MLSLSLDGVGKKFQREWVFRSLSLNLNSGDQLAITGSNGSGKSTLLKCIAGQMPFTEGTSLLNLNEKEIPEEDIYKHLVISAPYLELPEEFTLREFLKFHFHFKKITAAYTPDDLAQRLNLESALHKPISYFSSGMKQRLKLGICFFSQSAMVLLDEPTSNLDQKGVEWYQQLISEESQNKCLIIASNDPREYDFCKQIVKMEDYKRKRIL